MEEESIPVEPVRNREEEVIGLWGWQFHELILIPVIFFIVQWLFHKIPFSFIAIGLFVLWARVVKKRLPDGFLKNWLAHEWKYWRPILLWWKPRLERDYLSASARDYLWAPPVVRGRKITGVKEMLLDMSNTSDKAVVGKGQTVQRLDS